MFTFPDGLVVSELNEYGFVDDTFLGIDGRDQNILCRIQTSTQRRKRTLITNSGKLSLHKCSWILIYWDWKDIVAYIEKYDEYDKGYYTDVPEQLELEQSETGENEYSKA